jgi:antitoxin HicB
MLRYRLKLSKDTNNTILVDVPAVPAAHTFGEDRAEAMRHAPDAIISAFTIFTEKGLPVPVPDYAGRGEFVTIPALTEAKLGLYAAMRAAAVTKAELARRMGIHRQQVDRLLDLCHASRIEQIEAALRALGKTLSVEIHEAA